MFNNRLKILFFSFLLYMCAEDTGVDSNANFEVFTNSDNLNIITWNIEWFPKSEDTLDYLSQVTPFLLNADIIALQEITSTTALNQFADLLGENWVGYRFDPTSSSVRLAYLINLETITVNELDIIEDNEFFTREPHILKFTYNEQNFVLINNHFKCCGDGQLSEGWVWGCGYNGPTYSTSEECLNSDCELGCDATYDEEYRRLMSSITVENYISNYLADDNVIIVGDLNDDIETPTGVFNAFLNKPEEYLFADYLIAQETNHWGYWSYPTYPSHIDHIIITNELFDAYESPDSQCKTILIDEIVGSWNTYNTYISDHRPVALSLDISQ